MITFFLSIPNDLLAAPGEISWGDAITTKIGSVEIGMGSIFFLDPEVMLSSRSIDNLSRKAFLDFPRLLRIKYLNIISLKRKENNLDSPQFLS